MPREEPLEKRWAPVLQLTRVDVMRPMHSKMMAAATATAAMPAAGGRVARGCDRRNRQYDDSNGGNSQPTSGGRAKALRYAVD
jgi:hypothetical protein